MLTFCYLLLCSLGALALAAQAGSVRRGITLWLAGFGSGLLLFDTALGPAPVTVEPEQGAMLALLMAAFLLVSPRRTLWFMPAGGLLAVLWAGALQAQGFPPPLAWLLVAPSVLVALHCGRTRATFCTPALVQEVLVMQLIVASMAVLIPGVIGGWNTGQSLSAVDGEASVPAEASSALAVTAVCFVCGTVYPFLKNHMNKRKSS